jgi:hypothetical protein
MIWGIWLSRNKMIFQGLELNHAQVPHKIKSACNGNRSATKEKLLRILKEHEINFDWIGGSLIDPINKTHVYLGLVLF